LPQLQRYSYFDVDEAAIFPSRDSTFDSRYDSDDNLLNVQTEKFVAYCLLGYIHHQRIMDSLFFVWSDQPNHEISWDILLFNQEARELKSRMMF